MIDTTTESPIPLTQAADELPRRRRGRKTHVSTLFRWSKAGCKGVRLETIQVGGTRCTSREALQRFFERLSEPTSNAVGVQVALLRARSATKRRRDSEKAALELESSGA